MWQIVWDHPHLWWFGVGVAGRRVCPASLPRDRSLSLEGSNPGALVVAENLSKE